VIEERIARALAGRSADVELVEAADEEQAARLGMTGSPTVLVDGRYGRLLTVVGDLNGLLWFTTSNKDGLGQPVPSDDRVVVVPSGSSGGEGGPD
jgi:hypothetical protein